MSLPVLRAGLLVVVVDSRHPAIFLVLLELDLLLLPILLLRWHRFVPGTLMVPETVLRYRMETLVEVLVARLYVAQRTGPA